MRLTTLMQVACIAAMTPTPQYLTVRDLRMQYHPQPNTKRGKFKRGTRNNKKGSKR